MGNSNGKEGKKHRRAYPIGLTEKMRGGLGQKLPYFRQWHGWMLYLLHNSMDPAYCLIWSRRHAVLICEFVFQYLPQLSCNCIHAIVCVCAGHGGYQTFIYRAYQICLFVRTVGFFMTPKWCVICIALM